MIFIGLSLWYIFVFVMDLGFVGVLLAIACDEWIRAILVIFLWRERYAVVGPN